MLTSGRSTPGVAVARAGVDAPSTTEIGAVGMDVGTAVQMAGEVGRGSGVASSCASSVSSSVGSAVKVGGKVSRMLAVAAIASVATARMICSRTTVDVAEGRDIVVGVAGSVDTGVLGRILVGLGS